MRQTPKTDRTIIAAALIAGLAGGAAAQAPVGDTKRPPISAARLGKVAPGKENTPNGGRPEIHNVAEMRAMSGYTAPGAIAYADLAAEAGGKLWPVTLYYRCKNTPGGTSLPAKPPVPIEVFDGVYSLGTEANNIWAIKTSDGVILIDALTTEADAKQFIVGGLAKFGLSPKDIKLALITHGHLDHTGGVPYLRTLNPDMKVGMSELDWPALPKGPNDFVVTDGQKITLGDFTITAIITTGHTRGTISFVFPVKDKGQPHMASLYGGQGSPKSVTALLNFRQSLNHFADFTDLAQADVVLSNHTVGDDGLTKVAQLAKRKPGEPNPYVVGREGVIRYDAEWRACLSADIDQRVSQGATYDPLKVGDPALSQGFKTPPPAAAKP